MNQTCGCSQEEKFSLRASQTGQRTSYQPYCAYAKSVGGQHLRSHKVLQLYGANDCVRICSTSNHKPHMSSVSKSQISVHCSVPMLRSEPRSPSSCSWDWCTSTSASVQVLAQATPVQGELRPLHAWHRKPMPGVYQVLARLGSHAPN